MYMDKTGFNEMDSVPTTVDGRSCPGLAVARAHRSSGLQRTVAGIHRIHQSTGRPYRNCRVSLSAGRKTNQKNPDENPSLVEPDEPPKNTRILNGKQAAMVFVIIMVVLSTVSECTRHSVARLPGINKELRY